MSVAPYAVGVTAYLGAAVPTGIDWANLTVGVAAIVGLVYVVRSVSGMVANNNEELLKRFEMQAKKDAEQGGRDERRDLLLSKMAELQALTAERLDRLHDDNVQVARDLRHQDQRTADTLRAGDERTAEALHKADTKREP